MNAADSTLPTAWNFGETLKRIVQHKLLVLIKLSQMKNNVLHIYKNYGTVVLRFKHGVGKSKFFA